MLFSINKTIGMVTQSCVSCGCMFAVTAQMDSQFKDTGKSFSCPNGHSQSYSETTVAKLRKEIEALESSKKLLGFNYEAVKKKLSVLGATAAFTKNSELNKFNASTYLGISIAKLGKLNIPKFKKGRNIFYKVEELDKHKRN